MNAIEEYGSLDAADHAEKLDMQDAIAAAEDQAKRRQEHGAEEITDSLDKAVLAVAVSAPFIVLIFERMVL